MTPTGRNSDTSERDDEILIGISSCLLGENVRFDGGHKRYDFVTDTLANHVRFVSVCPEVEIGLPTPREPIRLVRRPAGPRLVAPKSGKDHTTSMNRYSNRRVRELGRLGLSGYILKKDSPSCGLHRVRLYDHNNVPARNGRGLFAAALTRKYPLLPVEEEGRLRDPRLRENFFERVFAYRRMKSLFQGRWTVGALVRFHSNEKLFLLAHDRPTYQTLGRLVAHSKKRTRSEVAEEYQSHYMQGLERIATVRKHTNVLQHILGHFKKLLSQEERGELVELIEDFRRGLVPLIVPITLIRHHVKRQGLEYLAGQVYLEPHPKELMLRNHV